MLRITLVARSLTVLLAVACAPVHAAEVPPPTEISAALKAVAFAPLPQPAYIEVKLQDDSPDNVRVAWEMHHALQRRGLLAGSGPTLRLNLDIEPAAMVGDAPARGTPREAGRSEGARFMGTFRATLTDSRNGQRLWEAEAVYETIRGDLAGGAAKLVPLFAESVGRSVEQRTVVLR